MSMRIHDHFPAPLGDQIGQITPFVGKGGEPHITISASLWLNLESQIVGRATLGGTKGGSRICRF